MIKKLFLSLTVVLSASLFLAPTDADAKRLGGGKSSGMQRNATPDKPAQNAPAQGAQPGSPAAPATAGAPAAAGAAAAAAAPKRSWMGPLAGLAAGLGLAALFSSLGLGGEMASLLLMLLIGVGAFFLIRFIMRRMAGGGTQPALAMAGATAGPGAAARPAGRTAPEAPMAFVDERPGMQRPGRDGHSPAPSVTIGSALAAPAAATTLAAASATPAAPVLPQGFDTEGFERLAKMLFIRLQDANDRADVQDLRQFTTPELFASLRLDLQDRGDSGQHTDVVRVDARLTDFAVEAGQQVVSVRFTGLVKEDTADAAAPFDEVWHLVRPEDESRNWAIAGIQQVQ